MTMKNMAYILLFYILIFSCTEDPITIPEPDTTPPQAIVLFPIDGEPVSGEVVVEVRSVIMIELIQSNFLLIRKGCLLIPASPMIFSNIPGILRKQ